MNSVSISEMFSLGGCMYFLRALVKKHVLILDLFFKKCFKL